MSTNENEPRPDGERFEEGEEAPPPGVRAMAIVRWILLAAMVLAAALSVYTYAAPLSGQEAGDEDEGPKYHCPMHPQITSDQPGECPICHMSLEPIPAERQQAPGPVAAPGASTVTAPAVLAPSAPAMPAPGASAVPAPGAPAAPAPPPPGTTPITLALDRVQAIGVRTARVERLRGAEGLRVTAVVEATEQGKAEVHFRGEGFVEAIQVRQLGVKVKAGQLLASIYSPEVFQAQQELLAVSSWPTGGDPGLLAPPTKAARKRLELLGLPGATIDKVVKTGQPIRAVGVFSPISGYVVRKEVVLGSRVTPGMTLFEIADLAKVYVIATVYPDQLAGIRVGDRASFTTPALPDRVFEAKVDLLYPDVDLATRTARVRFQIDNQDLALRPGQFGTAELAGTPSEALTIPLDAVVDTGRSTYVFVVEEGGRYVPRAVQLGEQVGERFVVGGGLREGETVVSGATFLIDAESRLQASFAAGAAAAPTGAEPAAPSGCDAEFDREKFPEKWQECKKCEAHRGMGTMEQDCRNAIPKPWR